MFIVIYVQWLQLSPPATVKGQWWYFYFHLLFLSTLEYYMVCSLPMTNTDSLKWKTVKQTSLFFCFCHSAHKNPNIFKQEMFKKHDALKLGREEKGERWKKQRDRVYNDFFSSILRFNIMKTLIKPFLYYLIIRYPLSY